ncbi:MAG: helix-turn-helix domain-containing protein [Microlunatus sp.]|nr:helix-turn-helix domain-containing protein [Microlunatus sp.]
MRSGWWTYIVTDGLDGLFAGRKEIFTVQEVADLLRMNKAGVYKWLKEGVIPGYRRGRSWFILRDELKDWMRLGSNQGRPSGSGDGETAGEAADTNIVE